MFNEEIEVVMPNLEVVMHNPKVVAPNLKVVTLNPAIEGMEEEVVIELSHVLEDLATCENWHVHRHNTIYVFNMPLIL
jgi:hypothetical protein